jgi:hypothetical protein
MPASFHTAGKAANTPQARLLLLLFAPAWHGIQLYHSICTNTKLPPIPAFTKQNPPASRLYSRGKIPCDEQRTH